MTSYTIGLDTIERMVQKIKEFPWPIYKIKLGTKDDLAIIGELRKHTPSVFRVDANKAWNAEQTIHYSHLLKELNVECIEQPLPPEDLSRMRRVFQNAVLPLIADESCVTEGDFEKCTGSFHGININLSKCGGLTPARRMIQRGKELGLKTMVGCMTESTVGISAIAHLLPLLDYVDMDGSLLLKNDIATGVILKGQKIRFPDVNGTGTLLV